MSDLISRQAAIELISQHTFYEDYDDIDKCGLLDGLRELPSAQPEREDYTEMKREFIRMASYIDSLLVCPDEQKETLMNFISRIAEDMPWTKRD